ncbi:MAG: hypothetical protein NVSMB23_30930 [Myxococcales bacterium]
MARRKIAAGTLALLVVGAAAPEVRAAPQKQPPAPGEPREQLLDARLRPVALFRALALEGH